MNILITSVSRKVGLVQAFQQALEQEGCGKVVAVDADALAPALYFADEHYLVPPSHTDEFLPTALGLCEHLDIRLLVPTRDEELLFFAEHRDEFADVGTRVMVPSPDVVRVCQDKRLFIGFCHENGFPVPRTYDGMALPQEVQFPLFAKPRSGKGGHGTTRVNSREELDIILGGAPDMVLQEYIDAPEYTVDLFADFSGEVITAVPRERLRILGGESFVSRTCRNPLLVWEAVRLAGELGLTGHNTIQCFLEKGETRFIEVNPRFGGAAHLSFAAGAPSPLFLVKLLGGEPLEPRIGDFKDNYTMLRYTQDLFLDPESLARKRLP